MHDCVCLQLFDLGDEEGGSSEADGTLIASQSESGYTCERQHTYRLAENPSTLYIRMKL